MPGHGAVHILEGAVTNHEDLAHQCFLGGTAIEADGTLDLAGGDGLLQHDGGTHSAYTQIVMTAAVTIALGSVGVHRLFVVGNHLIQTGQSVILAQIGDDGVAGAVFCTDGSGNGANAQLHPETLGFQIFGNGFGGGSLLQARFGVLPDVSGQVNQRILSGINGAEKLLFICINH